VKFAHQIRRTLSKRYTIPLHISRGQFLRSYGTALGRELKLRMGGYGQLTRLAHRYRSDKGVTIFPFNGYSVHYERLFAPLRRRPIKILEIGLARVDDRSELPTSCPSLNIWLEYFPRASVWGFDIDDFSRVTMPRTRIFRGDQGNPDDLAALVARCPVFDIIIDDGSHASYHQQITLKTLFSHLASEGLYVIEDLAWQPVALEASLPKTRKTVDWLKDRAALDQAVPGIGDIRFFDSPIAAKRDTLAVLLKA